MESYAGEHPPVTATSRMAAARRLRARSIAPNCFSHRGQAELDAAVADLVGAKGDESGQRRFPELASDYPSTIRPTVCQPMRSTPAVGVYPFARRARHDAFQVRTCVAQASPRP